MSNNTPTNKTTSTPATEVPNKSLTAQEPTHTEPVRKLGALLLRGNGFNNVAPRS
jgi:hypothetical protein